MTTNNPQFLVPAIKKLQALVSIYANPSILLVFLSRVHTICRFEGCKHTIDHLFTNINFIECARV